MKRVFTLLFFFVAAFAGKTGAQTTNPCNAEFTHTINNLYVNFTAALQDSMSVQHYWSYGDGTTGQGTHPGHGYTAGGTYVVKHYVKRFTPNGAVSCYDSASKTITLGTNTTCNLTADFNWQSGAGSQVIYFSNASAGFATGDSIKWTFGDGTSSYDVNPVHTYTAPGTYTVCLRVKKNTIASIPPCVKEICKTIVVGTACNLIVNYTFRADSLNSKKIYFTNTSTGFATGDSIKWSFGDGTYSTDVNPSHIYTTAGSYAVCLWIKKAGTSANTPACVRESCKNVVVSDACNFTAYFSTVTSPSNSLAVSFTNYTSPASSTDSLTWSFGDGMHSTAVNPVHIYMQPGTYTVCLRVQRNIPGSTLPCVKEYCKTVTVTTPCNLVAAFTFRIDSLNNKKVYFTNTSTGFAPGDSIKWSFGDGTYSNALNPDHIYATAGAYNVCLWVKKPGTSGTATCARDICKTVVIQDPCNLVVNFAWQTGGNTGTTLYFSNTSTGYSSADSITWTFGDGTSSNLANPSHTYTSAGTYNVCLRIKKAGSGTLAPCVREICKTITVAAPCNLVAGFTFRLDSLNNRNVFFTNTSAGFASGDSIRWTFGDGTSSTDVNPVHLYANAGTYNVCLWVKKASNPGSVSCVRETCKTITIVSPCPAVANFVFSADSLNSNVIHFINTSTSTTAANTTVKWTFGDGTAAYTWNADHQYTNPGTYTVCLRIATSNTCVREICKTVVVAVPCNRTLSYVTYPDQNNALRIYFNNTTAGVASGNATWTFGDGTSASGWNTVHEYANPGRYKVCLRVEFFPGCVKEKCDSITVLANPNCTTTSQWTATKSTVDCRKFKFTPAQINTTWQYFWSFGDGTGSTEITPEHRYANIGSYNVCLTVFKGNNCVSTTCNNVSTGVCVNCDSAIVKFTYIRNAGNQNVLAFNAVSNSTLTSQVWTITKFPISNNSVPVTITTNNPIYTFPDTGYYRVCLRAYTSTGCVKEYCEVIRIGALPTTTCTLQAYPNPASNSINIVVPMTAPEMIHTYVYSTVNVLVREKHQQGFAGNNIVTLDVANLIPGMYTVKVIYGNKICYAQFQKL